MKKHLPLFQKAFLFVLLFSFFKPAFSQGLLNVNIVFSTNPLCYGDSTGTASANAFGGQMPYTYQWDDPNNTTGQFVTGLPAGTWTVTVTDGLGNTATASVTLIDPPQITLSTSFTDATSCGTCDGTATANATGGTGALTYSWSDGQNTANATGLCPGTYTVTVTDQNMCQETATIVIGNTSGSGLTLTMSSSPSGCGIDNGSASVTVTGGQQPYTYLWDDPAAQTTQMATGLAPGTYTVIVTANGGCSDTGSVVVGVTGAPTVSVAVTNVSCNGANNGEATANVTGGATPYSYLWDDPAGQTTQTAISLSPGTYTVTVTDGNGCTATASGTITQPTAISLTTSSTNSSCGNANGSATVSASGGAGSYTYQWDANAGNQTTATASNLTAGSYSVIVTDANGCTATASATVSDAGGPTLSTSSVAPSCNGGCNGNATVTISGGQTPYTIVWDANANNQTTATASNLCAGTYTVTVTDGNGCSSSASVVVTEPTAISLTTSSINSTCGNTNGSATVSASGGTGSYSYQWNASAGSQTTATASNLAAGSYSVVVTDANGCSATANATVSDNGGPILTTSSTAASCNGTCDGSATVNITGGQTPYTIIWDANANNQTTVTASNLCAGTYTVTVTDGNGCSSSSSATVIQPTAISLTTSSTNSTCGNADGSASVSASGGTGSYSYQWNAAANNQTTATASNLSAGSYSAVVTDANGCAATASATVSDTGGPSLITSSNSASCFGSCDGSATVNISGGQTPYTIVWDANANNQSTTTASNLCAGNYTVTVTDGNGCSSSSSATVNQPSQITLSNTTVNSTCGNSNGSATVLASGGTGSYSYQWDANAGNQTTATANNLSAGTYNVTVTDASGCFASITATVSDNGGPSLTITSLSSSCNGICDGSATVNISGGQTPYIISWDANANNQTTATASNLCAGNYSVTVTDGNNCISSGSVSVSEPSAITLSTSSSNSTCGNADGTASVSATGGAGSYSYQWDANAGNQTTSIATGLAASVYSVTVTDVNGCIASASATVSDDGAPTISVSSVDAACNGSCDGSATVSATGGSGSYTYQWNDSNNQTTATANNLCTGNYSVTVTDGSGCVASTSVNVNEPGNIDVSTTLNGTTIIANNSSATYQWIDCANGSNISGANSQSFTPSADGSYAVIVTDGACSDTSACVSVTGVSVDEISEIEFLIAPNPSNGIVWISLYSKNNHVHQLNIYNLIGENVYSDIIYSKTTELDLSGFSNGTYFISIENESKKSVSRVVILK